MRFLLFFTFIMSLNIVHAQTCQPEINLTNSAMTAKEGHDKNITFLDIAVETDRYCPGETVEMTLLVLSESAVVGEHLQIEEVNTLVIPAGQISASVSIGIIGDNNWNEDRQFSVRLINPSHGQVNNAQAAIAITNDDPKIIMLVPSSIKEPRKGALEVPLRIELSMPADRIISGEIEIRGVNATLDEDFAAPYSIGFEILPGETYFDFLPATFKVLSDDNKEPSERVTFYMNAANGGSPYPEQVNLFIEDPSPRYRATIESVITGVADEQVAMISTYKHTFELSESETNTGEFKSEITTPSYSHQIVGYPTQPVTRPGLLSATAVINDKTLRQFRLEFVESPIEFYPYSTQPLYMFMSSFSKLHEDEFITITNPGSSDYPAFDFQQMRKISDKKWQALYKRSLQEDGSEALREVTTLTLEEM